MTKEEAYEIIDDTVTRVCDEYCKYPGNESSDKLDEICDDCPLSNLWDIAGKEIR